jgi:NADPH-dependent glutamate synthase beta subunit-like oxidoreductase/NAD-dependent dihydropyrimidine dehydrogenase PreA subunit
MALKRAASELGRHATVENQAKKTGKKIAVIGGGPAGLTAAQDLCILGHDVTVFERESKAGGMLSQTIPKYRLPREAVEDDIRWIESAGVKLKTGKEAGKDFMIEDLKNQGFEVTLIATGLPVSRSLPVFPDEHRSIYLALPFLKAVANGERPKLGDEVIVVGGGNVAIDVARSAKRLGVKQVKLVCLESREEMPAHSWEIEEAAEEGIEMNCCFGPYEVMGGEPMEGLRCQAVKSVFDRDGRFNPTFFEDKFNEVGGDTIIVSIGQGRDVSWLGDSAQAVLNDEVDGVFSAGEFAVGPGGCVDAMKNGHTAAVKIDEYLTGEVMETGDQKVLGELPERMREQVKVRERIERDIRPALERIDDFDLFEAGYAQKYACKEALRCMSCAAGAVVDKGKCVACLTCVRVCPYEIPKIGPESVAVIDPEECQACGICITECPALAIGFRRDQEERLFKAIEEAASSSAGIDFYCRNRLFFEDEKTQKDRARINVTCIAHVSARAILKAYELGAQAVTLYVCPGDECFYKEGHEWAQDRVQNVKSVLAAAGYEPDSLTYKDEVS